jgi:hypothetical protein
VYFAREEKEIDLTKGLYLRGGYLRAKDLDCIE